MKKALETLTILGLFLTGLNGCSIPSPDFFVPEITSDKSEQDISFTQTGGSSPVTIEANCDWTVTYPADWVQLSQDKGVGNTIIEITVGETRFSRSTVITIYSNEVESRSVKFNIIQKGVKEIISVESPLATDTKSLHGNTVTLTSSFEQIGIEEGDVIEAGFHITGTDYSKDIAAETDLESAVATAKVNDLTKDNTYTCYAWVRINGGTKKNSDESTFTTESLPADLLNVGAANVSNELSDKGTTATVTASFSTSVKIDETFGFKAGFKISSEDAAEYKVDADDIDFENDRFSADLNGLVPGKTYTVTPWAEMNGTELEGTSAILKTRTPIKAGTYEFTFTSDAWSILPTGASGCSDDGPDKIYTVEDNGFTWQVCGSFIEKGCLRIGSSNKIGGYYGWVIIPYFENLTVTKLIVPNDGSSASGKCCISILVSEDNGSSWNVVPGCDTRNTKAGEANASTWEFELKDQKPGCMYKIQNVKGSDHGNSMATKITVVVE